MLLMKPGYFYPGLVLNNNQAKSGLEFQSKTELSFASR